jgi:all-trans-retinol 13,14-reductase
MKVYDALVVGSGLGGLSAALHLANEGRHVLVLEGAREFGGYLNPFRRREFRFDVGLHYVGGIDPGQSFRAVLEVLGVAHRIRFARLPEEYDRLVFPELEFRVPAGRENFRARLLEYFPRQRDGVDLYMRVLEAFRTQGLRTRTLMEVLIEIGRLPGPDLARLNRMTYGEFLRLLFGDDALIRAVLSGSCGNIALPPGRSSAVMMLSIMNHFMDGAFYPEGGGAALKNAFLEALREKQVSMRRRAAVSRLICDGDRITAAVTEDGREFRARSVVSNVAPAIVLNEWLRAETAAPTLEASLSSVCYFAGVRARPDELRIGGENIWHYPSSDIDRLYAEIQSAGPEGPAEFPAFLTSPSMKAPGTGICPDGYETLQAIIVAPFSPFRDWRDQPTGRRDERYKTIKADLLRRFERWLTKHYAPDLTGKLIRSEISTPVTNDFFVSAPEGGMYGPAHTPRQMGAGRLPVHNIKNLFFCGAGAHTAGISPVCLNGYRAAAKLLNYLDGESRGESF